MPQEIDRYFYLHDEESLDDFDSEDWDEKIGPRIECIAVRYDLA